MQHVVGVGHDETRRHLLRNPHRALGAEGISGTVLSAQHPGVLPAGRSSSWRVVRPHLAFVRLAGVRRLLLDVRVSPCLRLF